MMLYDRVLRCILYIPRWRWWFRFRFGNGFRKWRRFWFWLAGYVDDGWCVGLRVRLKFVRYMLQ